MKKILAQCFWGMSLFTLLVFSEAVPQTASSFGRITGHVIDAVTGRPLPNVEIAVQARTMDRLSDGTLSLRSMEETIPIVVVYTDAMGGFTARVALGNAPSYFKLTARANGFLEMSNVLAKVETNGTSVIDFQLIKMEMNQQELEILDRKHEMEKSRFLQDYPSFTQGLDVALSQPKHNNPATEIKKSFPAVQSTYTVPDQVYVEDLPESGFTGYMDFDEFISGVISKEMGDSFPFEALKAQAVAARGYALERFNRTGKASGGQAYTSSLGNKCKNASANTSKIVMLYSGSVIAAFYSARCNGDFTLNSENGLTGTTTCIVGGLGTGNLAYARSRPCSGHINCSSTNEPCCQVFVEGRLQHIYGHGVGMCQRGAQQFAGRDGKDWQQILNAYYTNISFANLPALTINAQIVTTATVNVRNTACGTVNTAILSGTQGTIVGGPQRPFCTLDPSVSYLTWWEVLYNDGTRGWSIEDYLLKQSSQVQITITSNPSGRLFSIENGSTYSTPHTFSWEAASLHTVVWGTPQSGGSGTRFEFSAWTDGSTANPRSITIPSSDATYTADFTTQYFLTMNAGTGGNVAPSSGWQNSGLSVPISATPNSEYGFGGWTGNGAGSYTGTNASTNVNMNGPITETASFTPIACYIPTTGSNPSGSGTISIMTFQNCSGGYKSGTAIGLQATANNGYTFSGWTGSGGAFADPSSSTTTFTISNNAAITANFTLTPPCYNLTTGVNPSGSGSISITTPPNCAGSYTSGTAINLTATPGTGYTFNGWSGSGGTFSNPTLQTTTFTITGNATITASFTTSLSNNFWQQSGPSGKVVRALAINSNGHIFAGTSDDGVFRSTDSGGSWTQINNGLMDIHVYSLVINSIGHVFAGTSGNGIIRSVYRSTDNGENWSQVNFGMENTNPIYSLAVNSNGDIFSGTNGDGVFRSTDNGASWNKINTGLTDLSVMSLTINSNGHIFAGTQIDGIFRSTNNGDNWTPVNSGLTHTNVWSLVMNSSGHIFAGSFSYGGGVFRSTDSGDSWTQVNTGLTELRVLSLTTNSIGHIFAGTVDGVFRSIDNGSNWTPVNSGLTESFVYALAPNSSDQIFAGTNGSGVFRSAESTTSCYTFTTVVNPNGSGAITTSLPNCSGNYFVGTSINLTATPNSGYIFDGWSGSAGTLVNASSSTTTFAITGNAVVTATFEKPATTWAARYNGPANAVDEANALAVDNAGNVYVTGHSQGASSNRDYVTLKYNTAGTRQWSARYNAPANNLDEAKDIAVDASGNVYAAGFSYNANGNCDYFTIKYNSTGTRQWTARYNGPGNGDDKINALAVDGAGNVFVTGSSVGSNGNSDYTTIKYNSAGKEQWVKSYDALASNLDEARKIVVDGSGNVYVTGNSYGENGNQDYLTIKYDSGGNQQWFARYNGPGKGDDIANTLTIDSAGNVYVTGHSFGSNGSQDYATIKYNSAGIRQWVARYNGPASSTDEARGLAVDASGNVYVSGYSSAVIWNHDYFTIKYNSAGDKQWAARYNGPGNGLDIANTLAIDDAGNVYVTGQSFGSNGSQDFATIKYNSTGIRQWTARYNGPANNLDEARGIAVDASGNIHVAGYSLAANGQADYVTIKYSVSAADPDYAQVAESDSESLDEAEEGESGNPSALEKRTTVPAGFMLSQNYPNPFNPTTTIRFAAPEAGQVKLAVYNIYGELVKKLVDGEVAAGYHEVTFDAGNLATGIYFYRLEAGTFTATQKMILAK